MPFARDPTLGEPAAAFQFLDHRDEPLVLHIQTKDGPHVLGFLGIDDQARAAWVDVIAQQGFAPRPFPLPARRGNLVAGTSSSFAGPGDTKPLLPSWALGPIGPASPLAPVQPVADKPVLVGPDGVPPGSVDNPVPQLAPKPPTPHLTVAPTRSPSPPWNAPNPRI